MGAHTIISHEPGEIADIGRMESLEKRAGIAVTGVMAIVAPEKDTDNEYKVSFLADVESSQGDSIAVDVEIIVNCYNSKGQVCGSSSYQLWANRFYGVDTINLSIYCKSQPTRIKIIAKREA